ncbi:uncharacterized protein LOC128640686 [Bombina bombina]|uniref:uncharacterized protein LOC128640686 n=1 Tax=Bombina bombina TaxID=8345 RepID=UPI00235A6159|nr:uncharacterized protein LOC128640686 [Bombina bombina]
MHNKNHRLVIPVQKCKRKEQQSHSPANYLSFSACLAHLAQQASNNISVLHLMLKLLGSYIIVGCHYIRMIIPVSLANHVTFSAPVPRGRGSSWYPPTTAQAVRIGRTKESASAASPVGCDGNLHSTRSLDRCGVCGGDGSTCYRVSGSFRKCVLGYALITLIPVGAFDILITEKRNTENILVIEGFSNSSQFQTTYLPYNKLLI